MDNLYYEFTDSDLFKEFPFGDQLAIRKLKIVQKGAAKFTASKKFFGNVVNKFSTTVKNVVNDIKTMTDDDLIRIKGTRDKEIDDKYKERLDLYNKGIDLVSSISESKLISKYLENRVNNVENKKIVRKEKPLNSLTKALSFVKSVSKYTKDKLNGSNLNNAFVNQLDNSSSVNIEEIIKSESMSRIDAYINKLKQEDIEFSLTQNNQLKEQETKHQKQIEELLKKQEKEKKELMQDQAIEKKEHKVNQKDGLDDMLATEEVIVKENIRNATSVAKEDEKMSLSDKVAFLNARIADLEKNNAEQANVIASFNNSTVNDNSDSKISQPTSFKVKSKFGNMSRVTNDIKKVVSTEDQLKDMFSKDSVNSVDAKGNLK